MTGLEFLSALINSWVNLLSGVAWPVAAVTVALLFKREIHRLLQDLRSLKMGPFDAQFRADLDDAQSIAAVISSEEPAGPAAEVGEEISSLISLDQIAASAHPTGVIMESWKIVESLLDVVAERQGFIRRLPNGRRTAESYRTPERVLASKELISFDEADLITKMRQLRNHVAHSKHIALTTEQVVEYVNLATTAERFLSRLLRKSTAD